MIAHQKSTWILHALGILLALSLATGCGAGNQASTSTPSAVAPTAAPIALTLDVNPNNREIKAGKQAAIVAKVPTGETLTLTWSVEGTSGGTLSAKEGDAVFYTAGKPGVDIVTVKGTTAAGGPIQDRISFNVIAAPQAQPTTAPPRPTAEPSPPTGPTAPPSTSATAPAEATAPPAGAVTLTTHQDGQSYVCETVARGTYSKEAIKGHIWVLVYINGTYWPQDEGGQAPPMRPDGTWFSTVRIGGCDTTNDVGKTFQLFVVEADDAAHKVFVDWLEHGKKTGEFPGIPLPEGAKPHLGPIFVTRK